MEELIKYWDMALDCDRLAQHFITDGELADDLAVLLGGDGDWPVSPVQPASKEEADGKFGPG